MIDGQADRREYFGLGVTLGIVLGFVLGSVLTLRLGDELVGAMGQLVHRFRDRKERVNFELLLQ